MSDSEVSKSSSEESILKTRGYNLIKKIGEGSYAKVYLAEYQPETEPKVCITLACKVIDTSKATKEVTRKFMPRELHILTKLNHPNVIHVHSIFKRRSMYYIFMSFAANGDLLNYVQNKGPISESQARVWFRQIALGIQYIHEMEIAHRDIKCENVLLTSEFTLQLADFGFARYVVDSRGKHVLSDTYCGSFLYAAPEIVCSTPYNPKIADLWSVGVILFIILNKAVPFDAKNIKRLYELQVTRHYKFRAKIEPTLSNSVKKLVTNLLEPDTSKRWKIEQVIQCEWFAMDTCLMTLSPEEESALNNAIAERKRNEEKFNKTIVETNLYIVKEEEKTFTQKSNIRKSDEERHDNENKNTTEKDSKQTKVSALNNQTYVPMNCEITAPDVDSSQIEVIL